jgi:hypothetical protein
MTRSESLDKYWANGFKCSRSKSLWLHFYIFYIALLRTIRFSLLQRLLNRLAFQSFDYEQADGLIIPERCALNSMSTLSIYFATVVHEMM